MNIKLTNDQGLMSKKGFTLIELLIATSIIAIISIVSVRLLFSTVVSRARQGSIQTATDDTQLFFDKLSKTVKEAKRISVDSPIVISTEGIICRTFRLTGNAIEMAEDSTTDCIAPNTGFVKITSENTEIQNLNITKTDSIIDVVVSGNTKDSFGNHEFSYNTSIVKRTD